MKRVLVIDDMKTFDFPADWEVVYARTLTEGLIHLSFLFPLDELWLDHDLGGEDTIRPLVLCLADKAFHDRAYPVGEIVICSLNLPGIEWIHATLSPYYKVSACGTPEKLKERIGSSVATWY